jgi:tetratricopeptide (TPR) repeat protein
MISFFRELAALPLKLLFWICHFLHIPCKAALAALIWKVGGEIFWANTWIMQVCQEQGMDTGRQLADRLLELHKDARIALQMGMMEYRGKNPAAADQWIRKAETLNCTHPEDLLYLKYLLAEKIPVYHAEHIIDEMLSRNDLSMETSRAARLGQAWLWIESHQWQKADDLLREMLMIEDEPGIHVYKWIITAALGRAEESREHLQIARKSLPAHRMLFMEAAGMFALGRPDEARELLAQAIKAGMDAQDIVYIMPKLASLLLPPETSEGGER